MLEVFIKNTVSKDMKEFVSDNTMYYPVTESNISEQCSSLGIKCLISKLDYREIPKSTKADIVLFLDSNNYINNNYINNVVCMFRMYKNLSMVFGTQDSRIRRSEFDIGRLSLSYHCSNTNSIFNKYISSCYIEEACDYPNTFNGCGVNGSIYNSIGGYSYCPGPRYESEYNHNFLTLLNSYGKIISTDCLKLYYNVDLYNSTKNDLCKYYYDIGYQGFQKKFDRDIMCYDIFGSEKSMITESLKLGYSEASLQAKVV